MNERHQRSIERHCDVAIIGGSAAGLAAALQLGRQRRSVIVVDAGEPRNAPAAHMHSYLGHEGLPPAEFTTIGREEVRSYGGEILSGRATNVSTTDDGRFRVDLVGGNALVARRVLAATGLVDHLPDIDGLAEHWGRAAIHCPFCHGYEARDQQIVQIVTDPVGLHSAALFRQLTHRFTLVIHGGVDPNDPQVRALRDAGVDLVDERVRRIVSDDAGRLIAVELADNSRVEASVVAIAGRFAARIEPFESLGVATVTHWTGLGEVIDTGPTGETSVPGLYAAGNVNDPVQQVLQAAANGSSVAAAISLGLATEDIEAAARGASNQADWEHRYTGEQIWSGNPNGSLVIEAGSLTAGRALDVGAGEGGDAVWLAERGWEVTATDISSNATEQIAAVADERNLDITTLLTDANADGAFERDAYELVTAHYLSIPRTRDDRGVDNILRAVAPGGTLLIVGHDPAPLRAPIDTSTHTRLFDADAYIDVDDFRREVTDAPEWHIVTDATRPRPRGSATESHHVDDVVFRAYRRTRCRVD